MADLVIVESPTKAKEVGEILGSSYIVRASMGHIRDLPAKELGVDLESFAPTYVPSDRGKKTIAQLRKLAANSNTVYLATDLDREGEAIAWHLQQALNLKKSQVQRVVYNSITESAVKEAFRNARGIDYPMVKAQEARRVLDRLVGYVVSPALWESGVKGLSAGRVQSVTLRFIVERDREIRNHSKRKHFGVLLHFNESEPNFKADWITKPYANEDGLVMEREVAELAASVKSVSVDSYVESTKKKNPPPPFTTSTLQQTANAKLSMSSSKAMQVAQKLFEAGHITYMRTDSVNISEEGIDNIRSYADQKNLPLPAEPILHAGKSANAQEAHECIRPTDMFFSAESLEGDEASVYELIHKQTLACQLAPARVSETKVVLASEEPVEGKDFSFSAKAVEIIDLGFMNVMGKIEESEIPVLSEGDSLSVSSSEVQEKETKPPSHFTEGTLTAALEKKGIGRPATYASIIENIKKRRYVELKGKKLLATDLGDKLVQILRPSEDEGCTFMEYPFTSELEEKLDEIARGESSYRPIVAEAYSVIEVDSSKVSEQLKHVNIASASTDNLCGSKTGAKSVRRNKAAVVKGDQTAAPVLGQRTCPKCGKQLKRRNGKHGPFWGCTGYPECKHLENDKPKSKTSSKATNVKCDKCSKPMMLRKGSFGEFYGCSGFPECKNTKKVQEA